jgi:hypothetical protein
MDQLLADLIDGRITDEGFARLEELLVSAPELRDHYIEYLSQSSDLDEVAALALSADAVERSIPRGPWLPWALAAAACCVAMLSLAFAVRGRRARELAAPPPASAAGKDQQGPASVAQRAGTVEGAVAVVVEIDAVVWEAGDRAPPAVGTVLAPGRLRFGAGRVTLGFLNGVTISLEGPSDVDLVSLDRVFCRRGKIRAVVPDGAEGFVVASEGTEVVDLGTEFGLNVDADGKAQLMVFEGEVETALLRASGSVRRDRNVRERRALEVDPGSFQFREAEARPERFLSPTTLAIPTLELAPSYRDTVLAARPWGYWRFESMEDGAVPNEVGGRPSLRATGPVRLAGAGAGNRSVTFGPGAAEQYLAMDGLWAPPSDPGHAVELWFAPERIGRAALAGLFVPRGGSRYDHVFLLELTSRNRQESRADALFQRASIRFLHRWPPGLSGGDNLFSDYYVPYRWHHAVAQMRGDRMELYVDGVALPTLSVGPDRGTEACQFLVGRLKPLQGPSGTLQSRNFVGQIDEIALYDHPLSAEEVRRHHTLGTGRPHPGP